MSVKSSAISDSHLIVRYAIKPAPSEQLQRESTAHDTFQSGWLQVSKKNGEQSYLVCPGEIKHLGESEMASAYRCEYAGKIFPLKYLSTSIEELKNKKVLRQHILKVGNTLSVTSAMGFGPFVDSETNYPRLDELIVIDESNETQPSGSFMCLCFLMILLAGCLLKFIAGKVFARFTTPSRLISSQGTMVDSPETLERYSQMRQRIPAVVTSPAERDYEMLSELHRRLHSRSNTEHNAQRIRFLRSHFAASESAYVSNELQYMIDTQRAPRRITESTVTEPQSVSPIARPESINVQVPTSSTKTKRKVYVD
ncbi:MAG: hypothetical protein EOO52_13480 [Gammaproteobacteria bacterium]|nr:MAG: hypothetical protein EOO52_13480 [Gammaproteobacteria bacterium]